jgi:hypothetical protein
VTAPARWNIAIPSTTDSLTAITTERAKSFDSTR